MTSVTRYSGTLLAYGSVHFGKSLLWTSEDALTLFILVRIIAIDPALAGAVFLASSLWNALGDGLVGRALGRHVRVSLLPWIAAGAVTIGCLGFALLPFLPPGDLVAAVALIFLFRTGFCLADVPHNALTVTIIGQGEHLRIGRVRAIGSSAAGLAVGALCIPLLASDGARSVAVYAVGGIALAALMLMAPLPWLLARHADTIGALGAGGSPRARGGRQLWLFAAGSVIGFAGLAAVGKALLHVDLSASGLGVAALLLIAIGRLAAVWLWSPLARRIGNGAALNLAYAASALVALLMPPLIASGSVGIALLFAGYGLAIGGIAMLCWALLSEAIAAARAEGSHAGDAFAFSLFTMSTKIALGLSALLVGIWLSVDGRNASGTDPAALWPLSLVVAASCAAATLLPGLFRYRRRGDAAQLAATGLQR